MVIIKQVNFLTLLHLCDFLSFPTSGRSLEFLVVCLSHWVSEAIINFVSAKFVTISSFCSSFFAHHFDLVQLSDSSLIISFFQDLDDFILQSSDFHLVQQDLLVVNFKILEKLKDPSLVFEVFLLFAKQISIACSYTKRSSALLVCNSVKVGSLAHIKEFSWIDSVRLEHHGCFLLSCCYVLSKLSLLLSQLQRKLLLENFLLLYFTLKHLFLELDGVQLNYESCVLRSLFVDLALVSFFLLD